MPRSLDFGAAYYPEHWPESDWPRDIALMKAAGMTVARLGEFAWSKLEPDEGRFDFDWLDRAIDLLSAAGIATVLGTPTAAPPIWLTRRYPFTVATVDPQGHRDAHGARCHYCVNDPIYRDKTVAIARAMAAHFGQRPDVIGWQIDNEYNRVCYCPTCRAKFQAFVRALFEDLDTVNRRWSTAYWSQTYQTWDQIAPPAHNPSNPGLALAWREFVTESYRLFQQQQVAAIRAHVPADVWITHNFMKWFDAFDHYVLSQDLDLASWDWYEPSGWHDRAASGAMHDLVRGYKRKNFWLMETQPGHVNWAPTNIDLQPGQARAWAWHAIGHGADALLYWQWRMALNGQEQMHGSLVDQSGQPRPFYADAQAVGADFASARAILAGSTVPARVAILHDFASRWQLDHQRHHADFDYIQHMLRVYRALAARNIAVDMISADADLNGYAVVIAPALAQFTPERITRLKAFAARGHLVLGPRSGSRDSAAALWPERPPAGLQDTAGCEVEEYYALAGPVTIEGEVQGQADTWAERLKPRTDDAQVLARYGGANGWLAGQPAIVRRAVGAGSVTVLGAQFDVPTLTAALVPVLAAAAIAPVLETPPGVEALRRLTADGRDVLIVINHTSEPQVVSVPAGLTDHLTGRRCDDALKLDAFGVGVLSAA